MSNKNKIVITGIGAVSSYGKGIQSLTKGLLDESRMLLDFDNKYTQSCKVKLSFYNSEVQNSCIILLESAIKEALNMSKNPDLSIKTALVIGSGLGSIDIIENKLFFNNSLSYIKTPNVAGDLAPYFAEKLGITGQISIISTGCSSSNYAISYSKSLIELGKYERVVCCGVEIISTIVINCFNKMNGTDPTGIKPFDKKRLGSTAGLGAGVLIIENENCSYQRNVTALAEVGGAGYSCDSFSTVVPEPSGEQAVKAMRTALDKSHMRPNEITAIYAHGTGTQLNDVFESVCINKTFGDYAKKLPIFAMKSTIGHTGGASNILAACAAVISFKENIIYKTLGTSDLDSDCNINLTLSKKNENINAIMVNGFAFGGNNASLIIKKYTR